MLAVLGALLMSAATPPAPPTAVRETVEVLHGTKIRDPYRWLENADASEVKAWTEQQNGYLRKQLDVVPGRRWIEQRLWQLHETGALSTPVVKGRGRRMTLFYTRRDGKQNQPVLYARTGVDGPDRALVDVNAVQPDGTLALDWWFPSEDGKLVAYGTSLGGDEKSTLRVRDVAKNVDLPDVIPYTRYSSLAWLPDGRGFYYTRYPAPGTVPKGEEDYHRHVYFHALGSDPAKDPKIFGEAMKMTLSPQLAPLSPDGRWLVIALYDGWAKNDLYLVDLKKKGPREVRPLVTGRQALFNVADVLDDRMYVHTNEDAPRYRLFAVDPRKPERASWKEVLPQGKDTLEAVSYVGGALATVYLVDAASRVRVFSPAGKLLREVPLPGLGTVPAISGRFDGKDLFFAFSSYLTPTQVFRHDVATGATAGWRKLTAPLDPARFVVDQVRYRSKDGTQIPMFLVHRKGVVRDGGAPTLLYGYGGFNINLTPAYAAAVAPFVEAGGVYAVANLRGGGEYGEDWHRAGMLEHKQNVFDDFIAAGEYLVREKIADPRRLACSGRSNGGLLVGAAITQRPDLWRAAISGVPLLDMLRYHHFRIALWIPEYGSADEAKQFAWLHAYSPYHRVKDGTTYPATLIFTAEGDSRVDPLHARKMTARLQAATTGKKGPVLLRLETQAGHGQGKPLAKTIAQHADELAFFFPNWG